jgi:hypothetical protein
MAGPLRNGYGAPDTDRAREASAYTRDGCREQVRDSQAKVFASFFKKKRLFFLPYGGCANTRAAYETSALPEAR